MLLKAPDTAWALTNAATAAGAITMAIVVITRGLAWGTTAGTAAGTAACTAASAAAAPAPAQTRGFLSTLWAPPSPSLHPGAPPPHLAVSERASH